MTILFLLLSLLLMSCATAAVSRDSMSASVIGPATVRVCETSEPLLSNQCSVDSVERCLDVRGGPFSTNAVTGLAAFWSFLAGVASGIIAHFAL